MSDTIEQLRKDLEIYKEQCQEEQRRYLETQMAKLEADDRQEEAQKQLDQLVKKLEETKETLVEKESTYKSEVQRLQREKAELEKDVAELDYRMKECMETCDKLRNKLQINNTLPHKNINYTTGESGAEHPSDISYTCQMLIQQPYVLHGGQALVTFEDEKVAQRIIKKGRHNVDFNNRHEEVRTYNIELGGILKFEINMTISTTKVKVTNLPPGLPEDTLKDKLELAFYKSNIGGGEVESVEYNRDDNSACITYKESGVAQRVLEENQQLIKIGGSIVGTASVIEKKLNKLQIFSRVCQRTVQLSEIKNLTDIEDEIEDLIVIHFQKESNGGGEVECTAFSTQDTLAHFEEDMA
ncbi:N-myc-interactor [Dendropsophus ebraccatus]|uniref:N-myc-interactor n=1 Tax=Dendropsophus ebraccatus TaxID=150705 RepID=UPI0038320817